METETSQKMKRRLSTAASIEDAHDLSATGHVEELTRKFDIWSMLALAFCVLGTYSTFAQDLASGLNNGGPVNILWGLVLVTFCNICIALSLGELCSSMPTALGQAYWFYRLWETPTGRFGSYMCAWINTFGWWTLTASQIAFMTNFILGVKVMFDNDWAGATEGWVQFLVYLGVTLLFTVSNLVACRRDQILPVFNNIVGVWFVGLFFVISIALLASVGSKPSLRFESASFVFGRWINPSGWPDGVVWFTGLVQAAYGLTAFDSVVHLCEELPSPRTVVPRVLWLSVLFGAISGFVFMVVCLFCIQDLGLVLVSPTGLPFIELIQQTVGTNGGAALVVLFIANGLGQGISIATTASRLTWSFARDAGLPWHKYFAAVNPFWKVPARALWLQGVLIGILGVLYLFAGAVLQAILSVSTIALTISYAMPIGALLYVGRDKLPPGKFSLGRLGPILNWISIVYCTITSVFFFFPASPNPTAGNMNYAIAVFGVMLVLSLGFWFTNGRKSFLTSDDAIQRLLYARQLEQADTVAVDKH